MATPHLSAVQTSPEEWQALSQAHMDHEVRELHKAIIAGALRIGHSDHCPRRNDACYLSVGQWRNPYQIYINGVETVALLPVCVNRGYVTGPLKAAADAIGAWLGRYVGNDDVRPWRLENYPYAAQEKWDDCVRAAMLMRGGNTGQRRYYLKREAMAAFAKAVPRRICSCGKRLSRHHRWDDYHTYLVLDAPFVKIGKTINLDRRWKNNRSTDNPRPLTLLGVLCGDHERRLHGQFSDRNVGGEWFKDHHSIRAEFGIQRPAPVILPGLLD